MIAELLADYIWTHTSESSRRDPKTVATMLNARSDVRHTVARLAGCSRAPTDEEWGEATNLIQRRIHYRRELAGASPKVAAEAQADGVPE